MNQAIDCLEHPDFLHDRCAWCLRYIEEDEPVRAIKVRLRGHPDLAEWEGCLKFVVISGRLVAGVVPEPGSAASDCDMGFMLCGPACERRMLAAIEHEAKCSVVH